MNLSSKTLLKVFVVSIVIVFCGVLVLRYNHQVPINDNTSASSAGDINKIPNNFEQQSKGAIFDEARSLNHARILWNKGQQKDAMVVFTEASPYSVTAQRYANVINQQLPKPLTKLIDNVTPIRETCAQQLQFVAGSLDTAVQANDFKTQFENDQRLKSLPICISPVIWLAKNELRCTLNNNRNKCDLSSIAKQIFTPSYTHLVFFLDNGKAYVQNGAMHLDKADTYSVFVHELAHFVGFVDEYALSPSLAQQYCYEGSAPNLVRAGKGTIDEQEAFALWQVYNKELMMGQLTNQQSGDKTMLAAKDSLHFSDYSSSLTCTSLNINSYKPSKQLTFMEYHDTQNIPPIYLLMWKDLLRKNHQSVAVSVLFEEQAKAANAEKAAKYWSSFY